MANPPTLTNPIDWWPVSPDGWAWVQQRADLPLGKGARLC